MADQIRIGLTGHINFTNPTRSKRSVRTSAYPIVLCNFLPSFSVHGFIHAEKQNQSAPYPVLTHSNHQYLHRSTIIKSPTRPSLSSTTSSSHLTPGQKFATVTVTMRSLLLLLLPLILIAIHSSPRALADREATRKGHAGGWQPIKNISDPHVQEIAEFAVSEHNKLVNTNLALSEVVKGETQVVAGINYRLVLETKDGEAMATMWPWCGRRHGRGSGSLHHLHRSGIKNANIPQLFEKYYEKKL